MKFRQLNRLKVTTPIKFILAALVAFGVVIGLSQNLLSTSRTEPGSTLISKEQSASLFVIKSNGKWGYINRTGKVIISPQFESAGNFNEGLAVVIVGKEGDYKAGYTEVYTSIPLGRPLLKKVILIILGQLGKAY